METNTEKKFPIAEARAIANEIMEELRPHCERIEIVGSIRRNREDVKDIDLVIIPKKYETGLFATGIPAILDKFEKVRGELEWQKTRNVIRKHPTGLQIDCYLCEPKNYGLIKLIRTGSMEFNRDILIPAINRSGYKSRDGYLTYEEETVDVNEEETLFKLIGLAYIEPKLRNI